jgi:serine/threonine protein kinase
MDKSYIFLKSPIGSGGEANIYTVRIRPELVAKVYHQPHGDYARKLAFMVANPPVDPLAKEGRVSIAWATELVTDLGLVVGFLMPKLDTSKAKPIFQYYNPSERRKESPTFSYVSLVRTARNLARAVRSVHLRGYVIGDVNESNVLVADDAIVTLVDTDSFQVNDGTTVYRCTVGKPEYTPPELQGMSFRDVDRSVQHDLFGLGVLIYQLLMEGTHPFGGVFRGQGEAPELKERIKAGHFPHGRRGIPYNPMPLAPSFQMLPVALQELFLLCFEVGHGNPAARPTADVWSKALGVAEDGLVRCGVNGQHYYSGHLGVCPWCERAVKLGGRDPFPALGAIRSGQHLKPAVIGKAVGKPILKPKPNPPVSKTSTPNPLPSPVITPQVLISTTQIPSQPQSTSQPLIAVNALVIEASVSFRHISIIFLLIQVCYWNVDEWFGFLFICFIAFIIFLVIVLAIKNEIIGLIGSTVFLGWVILTCLPSVNSVAFSPDSKMIATSSDDKTIKLWNLNGRKLQTFTGHRGDSVILGGVSSVVFSPDGKMLASGSFDETVKLWSLDGRELQTFTGHSNRVTSVAFSPDGKMLASSSDDKSVKLWSLDGRQIQTLGHSDCVTSVAFSPDGKMLASSSEDNSVKLWSLDGRQIQTFTGHSNLVTSVAFSPDGKMLASSSWDNSVKLWSLDGRQIQTFTGHSDFVTSVAFSPDGKMLASSSRDNGVKLWSLDGRQIQAFEGHTKGVRSLAFSPDGKLIATVSWDKTVKLWKINGK